MKVVSALLALVLTISLFNSCVKDDFPVPPASTVSKFTYTIDNDSYAPATVTFTNNSIVPSTVGDAYYAWSFGDGSTSTEVSPVHTFSSPGSFEVKLIVKTTISLEIKEYSETIVVLNANASGVLVYFTDGSYVYSGYLNDDAPAFTALPIGPFDDSYGMAIDTINSKLYISDSGKGIIYRYDTETGSLITFRSGLSSPDGLAIDFNAGKIYWDTDNGIQRTDLSNTEQSAVEDFVTGQANDPEGVSIDFANSKLYWVNYDGGLWSINLDGTGKSQLLAEPEGGSTMVVGDRLYFDYYVGSGDIHLKSTNLDGTSMSTITTGISKVVFGLAYDVVGNKVYWGDRSAGKIMRGNLDGSGIETWFAKDGSSPRGIVFGKKK
jgi:PKD repeat protein